MTDPSDARFLVLATDAFEHGGIGRCTRTLLAALAETSGPARVALLSAWGGPADQLPGILWLNRDAPEGSGPVTPVRRFRFALRALRGAHAWRRELVLVANHPHLAPLAWLASCLNGGPFVVWAHGFEAWAPDRASVRWSMARATQVWAVSRFTAGQMEENDVVPPGKIRLLRHALPSDLDLADGAGGTSDGAVLSVARLARGHAYKGVDTLLEAWPAVSGAVPDARLEIIGDGDDRGRLERRAAELGVSERVIFRGHVSDEELEKAYRSARLFALPGRASTGDAPAGEGFGLVFLEAAAAGLPVVAGRAAGAKEAVVDGETGFLVDPRDPSNVAHSVIRLLQDDDLAAAMGRAGRRRIEKEFSFEAFQRRLEELLGELRRAGDRRGGR